VLSVALSPCHEVTESEKEADPPYLPLPPYEPTPTLSDPLHRSLKAPYVRPHVVSPSLIFVSLALFEFKSAKLSAKSKPFALLAFCVVRPSYQPFVYS